MFKNKVIKVLFGRTVDWNWALENITATLTFPEVGDQPYRQITYRVDDGLVLYFIERIEKLEKRVKELETKKK